MCSFYISRYSITGQFNVICEYVTSSYSSQKIFVVRFRTLFVNHCV